MLKNCYTFNAPDQAIIDIAKGFETYYKREFSHAKQQAGVSGGVVVAVVRQRQVVGRGAVGHAGGQWRGFE